MIRFFLVIGILFMSISCVAQGRRVSTLHEKDGKIGIGTPDPDEKLTVKGKIHTQEVLVDLEGAVAPDYVFEHYFEGGSMLQPSYLMPSLKELETYVQKNYHLPGIPSSASFHENGIPLKEMNLKLLEKIEELTLYTLQQQKEIEALQKQVKKLTETPQ